MRKSTAGYRHSTATRLYIRQWNRKIPYREVPAILRLLRSGVKVKDVAARYDVSPRTIGRLIAGNWDFLK